MRQSRSPWTRNYHSATITPQLSFWVFTALEGGRVQGGEMSNASAGKLRSPIGRPCALRSPSAARNRRPSAARRPPKKGEEEIPKYAPIVFCQRALKKTARGKLKLVDQFRKYKNEQVHNFKKKKHPEDGLRCQQDQESVPRWAAHSVQLRGTTSLFCFRRPLRRRGKSET